MKFDTYSKTHHEVMHLSQKQGWSLPMLGRHRADTTAACPWLLSSQLSSSSLNSFVTTLPCLSWFMWCTLSICAMLHVQQPSWIIFRHDYANVCSKWRDPIRYAYVCLRIMTSYRRPERSVNHCLSIQHLFQTNQHLFHYYKKMQHVAV